jgi:hypothetical protein
VLPFDYAWAIIPPPNEGTFKYTAHDCAPPYEANNGQEFIVSVPSVSSGHLAKTTDGTTFAGTSSPPDGSESWSFIGSD